MQHALISFGSTLRIVTLAAAMMGSCAYADDYADVSQLVRSGKLNDALAQADVFLANKPRDPQMRFLKGVIQRDSGKPLDAIATFSKLTEDYPELPEPYNNLAVLYAGQNQFDKARAALEMAIRTNPSYATAHENLGDVYAKLASQAYNKALQLDASNQGAAPKLALIRELFSPSNGKSAKPIAAATGAPVAAPTAPTVKGPLPTAPVTAAPVVAKPNPLTPTAPAATVAAAPATANVKPQSTLASASDSNDTKDAQAAVLAWAKAWSSKDVKGYLAAYGSTFTPPNAASRSAWEAERTARITGKSNISVKLENLQIVVNGNLAQAKFRQDYKGGNLSVSSRKTLDLAKVADRWQIVKESTGS